MLSTEMIDRLKKFSLFKDIADNHEKMSTITSIMEPKKFHSGEYIFKEGDQGDELYLLISGSVRVLKETRQKEEYTIVDLDAASNIFFGEIALMDSDRRSASIRVVTNCEALIIHRDPFIELGNKHPEICLPITRTIVRIICGRLRNINNDVILLFDALVNEIQDTQL